MNDILPTSRIPAGHPGRAFVTGRTPFFACRADQRFSYALYVPSSYREDGEQLSLLVAQHGTYRDAALYLTALQERAEQTHTAIMAPLFPAGIEDPNDLHNYKFLDYQGIRFDLVLPAMVDEVAARWHIRTDHFALHGFSGGGQFAQRFLLLHPDRLHAVSIGAPGRVTLPTSKETWWRGVGDLPQRFGLSLDPEAIAKVNIQLVIGEQDSGSEQLASVEQDSAGADRQQRIRALRDALRELGARPQLHIVPGAGHEPLPMLPALSRFLRSATLLPREGGDRSTRPARPR
ncbi:hypothetical protein [Streptomyces sp. NPDC059479]|uniref:hypothetical protein n=1 Tax=Streptomyces sp. NPDC059479 TaxID=3346848 RepID=UPI00369E0476